jgi:hypothetical protein
MRSTASVYRNVHVVREPAAARDIDARPPVESPMAINGAATTETGKNMQLIARVYRHCHAVYVARVERL